MKKENKIVKESEKYFHISDQLKIKVCVMKMFFCVLIFLFLNFPFTPFTSFAVDLDLTPPGIGGDRTGKAVTPDFIEYLDWLYKVLLGSTGILALIMIVAGGIMYIFAGASGKPQDISKAKTMIISAIAGLLLALGSWIILNTINPDLLKKGLNLF